MAMELRPGLRWYVIHCAGWPDSRVVDWLDDHDFETYYPMIRELRPIYSNRLSKKQRASGIRPMRPKTVPFLPRYVFVRFDATGPRWREIFAFAGAGGLVCEGDLPAAIPDQLIDSIREREIDGAVPGKTPAKLIFRLGERVRIASGPFAAFHATVEKLPDVPIERLESALRVKVAVGIFGGIAPVELELSQIEKA